MTQSYDIGYDVRGTFKPDLTIRNMRVRIAIILREVGGGGHHYLLMTGANTAHRLHRLLGSSINCYDTLQKLLVTSIFASSRQFPSENGDNS